jgi:lactoylglutathione lyase
MAVRAIGFNHVAFEVRDLDQALEWYGRFFDFRLRGRRGGMAWIDLGDQFLALTESDRGHSADTADAADAPDGRTPDHARHVGLVVSDKETLRAALIEAGEDVSPSGGLRVHDPSGNQLEIVDYRDVQFSKTPGVLRAMALHGLDKSESARAELRAKGIFDR